MDNVWLYAKALIPAAIFVGAVGLGLLAHAIVFFFFGRVSRRSKTSLDDFLVGHTRRPLKLILPLLTVYLAFPALALAPSVLEIVRRIVSLAIIASVAWLLLEVSYVVEDMIMSRLDFKGKDNLKARAVYTQIQVFKRVAGVAIAILTLGAMLMTFDRVRQLGTSILASAGIIGIIVGFAAQRTLGTIMAGIQIAVTQPIRIDDVVVVEGEWGRIEEITFTYVVVRIWDLRRLIVPITYFLEKPFRNWTRVSADILGTVCIYADYTVPVQAVRDELSRILKGSNLWDGKAWGLQVTDATDRTVELRALMSAADSSAAWDLRCYVRENLIAFLQKNYPDSLPKVRAETGRLPENTPPQPDAR
jgi:small-conductance mechanosensitive channel